VENREDNNLYTRHHTEKGFNVAGMCLELDARIKTLYATIDELKAVIQGQAAWAESVDLRLKKLEPTIQVFSEGEAKIILKG